jgi:hypothetical protein
MMDAGSSSETWDTMYQFTGRHILQDLNLEHLCKNLRKLVQKPTASSVNILPFMRWVPGNGRAREAEETADDLNTIWRHADAI